MRVAWSPELETEVRRLFEAGFTMTGIATELGQGLTKGAVVGKLHRLGALKTVGDARIQRGLKGRMAAAKAMADRDSAAPRKVARSPKPFLKARKNDSAPRDRVQETRSIPFLPFLEPVEGHRGIGIMELTSTTCRWPFWDVVLPAAPQFCGAAVSEGAIYCKCHELVAHRRTARG